MTYTLSQIQAMTVDEVRRALAEKLGWKFHRLAAKNQGWPPNCKFLDSAHLELVPDYPNDANEWCKLMCRVNAEANWVIEIYADSVWLRKIMKFDNRLMFKQDNTPESIGLAVCRAALWAMQGEGNEKEKS